MAIKITKKYQHDKSKIVAVWSPTNAGKTFVATNLASYFSLHENENVSLIDLTLDKAIYTWLNCPGTDSLKRLLKGEKEPYNPTNVSDLNVYTSKPTDPVKYNGNTEELNRVLKVMQGGYTFIDLPSNYLVAGNILSVADLVVLVCDYNIHSSIAIKEYFNMYSNVILVANRANPEYPELCDPANIGVQPDIYFPDEAASIYESILSGRPVVLESLRPEFERLYKKVLNKLKVKEEKEIAK